MRFLLAVASTLLLFAPRPASAIDIACLGDSITQSNSSHLSYRYNLWVKLLDDGRQFDMVGSLENNSGGNPSWPLHNGSAFDQDHEGHWAWRADDILNGKGGGGLATWLAGYTPDVVLIHIGSNDALQSQSTPSTVAEIGTIIDTLRADNASVTVFLAKLIPTDRVQNPNIIALNAEIDGIASTKSTAASPIFVVDQFAGFDVAADTFDGIHPDESGEEKMAQKWFAAMAANLPECSDGLDNDGDLLIDYAEDTNCSGAQGASESPAPPTAVPSLSTPARALLTALLLGGGLHMRARRR
ncbi:MAG: cellulose-binding protein [Deltaproteobacteria bacterium]|nr:cellulose-binding protein [Deltaproteobacteria bacterium]